MPDFADILKAATAREEVVEVCVSGALNSRIETLEARLRDERAGWSATSLADTGPGVETAQEIEHVRQQMREATFTFTFRSLPARAWSDLLAAHPPREGQPESFNAATLPQSLIALCATDPELTVEQVDELFEVLNQGQRDDLFAAAWQANKGADIPFSRAASEILRTSAQTSTSPAPGDSRAR